MVSRFPRAVAISAALMLAAVPGCTRDDRAPTSVAISEEPGISADAPIQEVWNIPNWSGEPFAWVSDNGATVTVATFGSSSCPFIGVSIEALTRDLLDIDFRRAPAQACTDDLAGRTHVFALPDGVASDSRALQAQISLDVGAIGPTEPRIVRVPVLSARSGGASVSDAPPRD